MTTQRPFDERLNDYLEIVVKLGVNLQPDQTLVVSTGPATVIEEFAPLVRTLTRGMSSWNGAMRIWRARGCASRLRSP